MGESGQELRSHDINSPQRLNNYDPFKDPEKLFVSQDLYSKISKFLYMGEKKQRKNT